MSQTVYQGDTDVKYALRNCCAEIAGLRAHAIANNTSGPLTVATPSLYTAAPSDVTAGGLAPRH